MKATTAAARMKTAVQHSSDADDARNTRSEVPMWTPAEHEGLKLQAHLRG